MLVVDEFAALASEVPEFVDGVVDIAQRGRSLGIHLILATQRPAGVIKDNLRANTNLRVALRMADESDSNDVVGEHGRRAPSTRRIPGRGIAKTGPGRLVPLPVRLRRRLDQRRARAAARRRRRAAVRRRRARGRRRATTTTPEEREDLGPTDQKRLVDDR